MSDAGPVPVTLFGTRGFIGGVLASALPRYGHVLVRGFSSQDADFAVETQVRTLADRLRPNSVWVIAAAQNPDRGAPPEGVRETNNAITANLIRLAEQVPPRHIVFLSSVDVYGRTRPPHPISEDSPLSPETPYAQSKVESEADYRAFCSSRGVPLAVLRLPGIYGPGDTHRGPVRCFMEAAQGNQEAVIHGNGEQLRDLTYVGDLPGISARLCGEPLDTTLNVVSGRSVSLNHLVQLISEIRGNVLPVVYQQAERQTDLVFESPARLSHALGLTLTPIETGLALTYRALQEQKHDSR